MRKNIFMYSDLIKKQPKYRKDIVEQLEHYLKNKGRFSVLVLGERGTGKTFWIEQITKHLYPKQALFTVDAALSGESTDFWMHVFKKAHQHLLVIDNVEKLTPRSQELLIKMLSTSDGQYGFEEKEFDVRLIFTSSFDISVLRDSEAYLLHHFFDRISQLVVKFPSFKEKDAGIWQDFLATWNKMNFGAKFAAPKEILQIWLEKKSAYLHGNFRDLDKIAINWQQYQIIGEKDESEILKKINDSFELFLHYPEQKTELHDTFIFKKGKTKDEMEAEWRMQFKKWAKREYGTLKKAAQQLQMSERTFEKW